MGSGMEPVGISGDTVPVSQGTLRARALWVHGYGEHSERYRPFAEFLAARGVESLLLDLPGHGRSDGEPGELPELREMHHMLREQIGRSDEAPQLLIGHSLGGLIAASFAARHPGVVTALVLSSPVLWNWSAITAFEGLDQIPPSQVRPRHLSRRESFAEEYNVDPKIYRGPMTRSALRLGAEALSVLQAAEAPPEDSGGMRDMPVLWMHGAADRIAPAEDAFAGLASLRLRDLTARVFPNARHELLHEVEAPEALAELGRFVDRVKLRS